MAEGSVHFQRLEATATDITLPMGLRVSQFTVGGGPFRLDLATRQAAGDPLPFAATVDEDALTEFLVRKGIGGLNGLRCRLAEGFIEVTGRKVMLIEIPVSARVSLHIVEGRQLHIRLESANVLGAGVGNLLETQIAAANPVLDAAEFPVPVRLERVEIGDGWLRLFGEASLPPELAGG
jgi:hypothetical protein